MIKKRILAIDDSAIALKQLQNILDKEFEFVGVTSGLAGLKRLDNEVFDLVLLDIEMPVMDGFATLTSIRQRENLRDLPIIILTGTRHKEKVVKGITSGVAGYIVKPADSEQLVAKIETALGLK
ncbi:MAG: response regulator [Lachnospiraceae bacterium]|nr:response regulator [Lachnospiraceae bacterium]